MFDLKVIHSVLDQLEEERGIPREKILEAIELALATAYKKEYGRKGQYIRAIFDLNTGNVEFCQVKTAVDPETTIFPNEDGTLPESAYETNEDGEERTIFNDEQHIPLDIARKIKKDIQVGEELVFPLETKADYGRIAAQTAKQVIIQKIREAEKISVLNEFGKKEGEIVSGTVERSERGTVFINMGRAIGILPYDEQIPGEHYNQGERIRACLMRVEETPRGIFLRLSRATPQFLAELFKIEVPEIGAGTVEVKAVAREAGARSKIAVTATDSHIDPIGSMVGQRGVRVNTVMSELGGEKIDIIDWSENPAEFIESALSPAKVVNITLNEVDKTATVEVTEDQQSLAIGKSGQNARLAARLTGWRINIQAVKGDEGAENEEAADLKAEKEEVINEADVAKLIADGVLTEEKTEEESVLGTE
ncbi:MAG: transcription termination factor NusA [bacterium]